MEHGPKCWGSITEILQDRNGECVYCCTRCRQLFLTSENGHDVQILQEFGPDDEPMED